MISDSFCEQRRLHKRGIDSFWLSYDDENVKGRCIAIGG